MYYILLDEPFNPSVLDPGNTYDKLFISWLNVDMINQTINMGLEFGDTDGYGIEIKGIRSQTLTQSISGSDWNDFCTQTSSGEDPMVDDFQYYLLNKLITDGVVDGTIYQETAE